MMKPSLLQNSEFDIVQSYFSRLHDNAIIWPQELNSEVNNYFEKCFDWWLEVKEEDQSYSDYTVFTVTESQALEFIRAANEQKWGLGSHCYAMVDGNFKWGRD
jgi:hypothetical protein